MGTKAIQDRIKNRVTAAGGVAAASIQIDKTDAWPQGALPAVRIWTGEEEVTPMTLCSPRRFRHHLPIYVEYYAQGADEVTCKESLITLAESLRTTLLGDRTLNGEVDDLIPVGTINMEIANDGKKPTGQATLQYRASYQTVETA